MTNAWTLMTAMPPTIGHKNLLKFASQVSTSVNVVLNTMPHEPYPFKRARAVEEIVSSLPCLTSFHHIYEVLPQSPEETDTPQEFWDIWKKLLYDRGFKKGDYIVASEDYAIELAKQVDGHFIPYNPDRSIHFTKATEVRNQANVYWKWIAPEFQKLVRPRVTFFGAESCGKTTVSKAVADFYDALWLPEYARPYLEMVGPEVTAEAMGDIHLGQLAYQNHAHAVADSHQQLIVQDTDLFSTVGYWGLWDEPNTPASLVYDANGTESDLYIIMNTNIPFEEDPLRYGGKERESDELYWESLAIHYDLNYHMMQSTNFNEQVVEAAAVIKRELIDPLNKKMQFNRTYN